MGAKNTPLHIDVSFSLSFYLYLHLSLSLSVSFYQVLPLFPVLLFLAVCLKCLGIFFVVCLFVIVCFPFGSCLRLAALFLSSGLSKRSLWKTVVLPPTENGWFWRKLAKMLILHSTHKNKGFCSLNPGNRWKWRNGGCHPGKMTVCQKHRFWQPWSLVALGIFCFAWFLCFVLTSLLSLWPSYMFWELFVLFCWFLFSRLFLILFLQFFGFILAVFVLMCFVQEFVFKLCDFGSFSKNGSYTWTEENSLRTRGRGSCFMRSTCSLEHFSWPEGGRNWVALGWHCSDVDVLAATHAFVIGSLAFLGASCVECVCVCCWWCSVRQGIFLKLLLVLGVLGRIFWSIFRFGAIFLSIFRLFFCHFGTEFSVAPKWRHPSGPPKDLREVSHYLLSGS